MSRQGPIPGVKFDSSACTPANVAALSNLRWQWIRAAFVSCIGFGAALLLAINCFYLVFAGRSPSRGGRREVPMLKRVLGSKRAPIALLYVSCLATLSAIAMVSMTQTVYKSSIALGCWNGLTPTTWFFALDLKAQCADLGHRTITLEGRAHYIHLRFQT